MSEEEKVRLLIRIFPILLVILLPVLICAHICLSVLSWIESVERTASCIRILRVLAYNQTKWKSLAEIAQESRTKEVVVAEVIFALVEDHSLAYRIRGSLLPDDFSNEERNALYREKPNYNNCGYFEYKYRTGNNKRKKWYERLEIEKLIPSHAY